MDILAVFMVQFRECCSKEHKHLNGVCIDLINHIMLSLDLLSESWCEPNCSDILLAHSINDGRDPVQ